MKSKFAIVVAFATLLSLCSFFVVAHADEAYEPNGLADSAVKIDLSLGYFEITDPDGDTADGESARASGSIAFKVQDVHVQIDNFLRYDDSEGSITIWGVGGHFGWRDETRGHIAVNTAYNNFDLTDNVSAEFFRLGGEGEIFLERLSLGGQAGVFHGVSRDEDGTDSNELYYFKGLARYYVRDNLKIEGSFGRVKADGADGELDYVHVLGEYGFDDRPITIYTRWNGLYVDDDDGDEFDTQQFLVGLTVKFGGARHETIKTNDRRYFSDACLFDNVAPVC